MSVPTTSTSDVARRAAQVAGFDSASSDPQLTLLAGGATGATFKLSDKARPDDAPEYVARVVDPKKLWAPGMDVAAVSRAVASAGLGAGVVGVSGEEETASATEVVIVYDMLKGRALTVDDLMFANGEVVASTVRASEGFDASGGAAQVVKTVAQLAARFHRIDQPAQLLEPAVADEVAAWRDVAYALIDTFVAGVPEKPNCATVTEAFKATVAAELDAAAAAKINFYLLNRSVDELQEDHSRVLPRVLLAESVDDAAVRAALRRVLTHGDLHIGNLLATSATDIKTVDLDRSIARHAVSDVAYFFMTWGDQYYHRGFVPSAEQPSPYVPYESRVAFVKEYLKHDATLAGVASAALARFDDDDGAFIQSFLLAVEVAQYAERARLFFVLAIFGQGDLTSPFGSFAVQGFSALLPAARNVLVQAASDGDLRATIVRRGLFVCAASALAAAAASSK